MSNHHHEANHLDTLGRRSLLIVLIIVLTVMVAEVIGGLLSNSLALLSDAGHMLVDALALGLSLFAMTIARRPATATKTYGYHRVEIMATLVNGSSLLLIALFIFFEAYQRFADPPEVRTGLMLGVAIVGLLANLAGIMLLRRVSHLTLNIKAAFWHVIGDTISSVGVITASIVIALTGWRYADPIAAIVIGCIILWGAVQLVRESVDILLEAVPGHIRVGKVEKSIKRIPGVVTVHDLHIWTLTSGIYALSAHLMITDQMVSRTGEIVDAVNRDLAEHFGITHTTLQLECDRCASCPSGFVCEIKRPESEPHEH